MIGEASTTGVLGVATSAAAPSVARLDQLERKLSLLAGYGAFVGSVGLIAWMIF